MSGKSSAYALEVLKDGLYRERWLALSWEPWSPQARPRELIAAQGYTRLWLDPAKWKFARFSTGWSATYTGKLVWKARGSIDWRPVSGYVMSRPEGGDAVYGCNLDEVDTSKKHLTMHRLAVTET